MKKLRKGIVCLLAGLLTLMSLPAAAADVYKRQILYRSIVFYYNTFISGIIKYRERGKSSWKNSESHHNRQP